MEENTFINKAQDNFYQEVSKNVKQRKREGRIGIIIIIIFAVLMAYWIKAGGSYRTASFKEQQGLYQAVFLSNGQVYFGTIQNQNQEEVILSDIYYFNTSNLTQANNKSDISSPQTSTSSDTFSLIKLGSELHKPLDEMRINRKHILFIEDLNQDSPIIAAIKNYKTKKSK